MRFLPPGVCAINGLLYVIGGDDGSCNLSSVEFYNPAADKWSLIPTNMSNGRSYAGQDDFLFFFSRGTGSKFARRIMSFFFLKQKNKKPIEVNATVHTASEKAAVVFFCSRVEFPTSNNQNASA